jgi:hypothetical protein
MPAMRQAWNTRRNDKASDSAVSLRVLMNTESFVPLIVFCLQAFYCRATTLAHVGLAFRPDVRAEARTHMLAGYSGQMPIGQAGLCSGIESELRGIFLLP